MAKFWLQINTFIKRKLTINGHLAVEYKFRVSGISLQGSS